MLRESRGITEVRPRQNGDSDIGDTTSQPAFAGDTAAFLTQAARTLTSSLDFEETLKLVARLAVPVIADWCVVDIVDQELSPKLRRLTITHADPEKERWGHEIARRYPPFPINPSVHSGWCRRVAPSWSRTFLTRC